MKGKLALVGIVSNPVTSLNSHNGGWTLILKNILNANVLTEKDDWFFNFVGKAPKYTIDKKTIDSYRDWNNLKDFKKYGI